MTIHNIWLCVCLISLVSVVSGAIALHILKETYNTCTIDTIATVQYSENYRYFPFIWRIMLEYTDNEEGKHTKEIRRLGLLRCVYDGEEIVLHYNPDDTKHAYVGATNTAALLLFCMCVFAATFILSIIFIIVT